MTVLRWLMCRTGWCGGLPICKTHTDGRIWCAWQCATCGAIKHAHPVPERSPAGRSALAGDGR